MKYIIIVMLLPLVFSCEDFLEKEKLGEETFDVYYNSEEKAIHSVTAAYSDVKDYRFGWTLWAFGETLSDNAVYSGSDGDNAGFELLKNFNGTPDMHYVTNKWRLCYRGINKASQAIEGISKMDDNLFSSVEVKHRLIAEARFLRAFFHYELVRAFGRIPIVDHWVQSVNEKIGQSEIGEVYGFIIDELEIAAIDLPLKSEYSTDNLGRVTKGTAHAYLAKANMYMENWGAARDWALEVIESEEYGLDPDFGHVFSFDGEHGIESVFEISFHDSETESSAFSNNGNFQTLFMLPRNITYGYGINQPTQDLFEAFEAEGDVVRRDATLLTTEEVFEIELADFYVALEAAEESGDAEAIAAAEAALEEEKNKLTFNRTGFYNEKMYVSPENRSSQIRNNGNNIRLMRYAEVLLIYAEACAHTNAEGEAREKLNWVRDRAGLEDVTASGQDLLESIYTERRLELAGENDRYHDLVRLERADKLPGWSESRKYWPVPQAEIDVTTGEIEQNEGYTGSN
ncbi:RagB/SusD family nutrient uptake outer membrane protein [Marinilabilia sp.]|uniref:RagB/SusD family nutrient uptake outer membrane protein n=1 Tax=Marinilabilia sp. TaxID=2021252 RepID=UPI0025C0CA21|nr:RagB/SusD family nutrient uptake outer membrane protein [Marinilabilia sp.]